MELLHALAFVSLLIIFVGGFTFAVTVAWLVYLEYKIHAHWRHIGPQTEQELRAQGMPYLDGLGEGRPHRLRLLKELKSRSVTTNEALAHSIHQYRYARRTSFIAGGIAFLATLVLSSITAILRG